MQIFTDQSHQSPKLKLIEHKILSKEINNKKLNYLK